MSESELPQGISNSSISTMLQSIKDCTDRLEAVVFDMEEMQESLSANISREMT